MKAALAFGMAFAWTIHAGLAATQSAEPLTKATIPPQRPALILAVERGQQAEVERLLRSGADLEVRTPDGVTPLYAAAYHGRTAILKLLIGAGAKVDGRAACGRTPLFTAAAEGRVEALEALLASGANPNARSDTNELAQTPLHMAAVEGQVGTAKRLLDRGAEVNAWTDKHRITPLYLATIGGHDAMAAFLRERGADPNLADVFGQTPERAGMIMAMRKDRKLEDVHETKGGFDARTVVVLAYIGLGQDRQTYRGNRVGVVVGDGTLIATAAHCVDDFLAANRQTVLAKPLIVSPYLGDVFEAEIVGVDQTADLAILRVRWNDHPTVPLAAEEDLASAREMLVAGYPPPDKAEGQPVASARQIWAERLPLLQVLRAAGAHQIVLGGAMYVGPGWSGSPIILPESGRLAGVFSRKEDLRLDDVVVLENRTGASSRALRALLATNQNSTYAPARDVQLVPDAAEAFSAALGWLDAQAGRPPIEGVQAAKAFTACRPRSARAQLFAALSSTSAYLRNPGDISIGTTAQEHYQEAVRLDPNSVLVHAAYGVFLDARRRSKEALAQLVEATRLEPENTFAQAARLKVLSEVNPAEAQALGQQLTSELPDNAVYWFHYAGALRALGRQEDALRAAETAVQFASNEQVWFNGRLADLLTKAGRIEDAEKCYRLLLEHRPNSPVFWSWYAQFLADRQPERASDLRRALDQCESLNQPAIVPQKVLDQLRAKLQGLESSGKE
jgi:tetratricopeptide (TPR) repeat protein